MYYSFKYLFLFIAALLLIKAAYPLVSKLIKFEEDNYNFKVKVTREKIHKLTEIEFEGFCAWLFNDSDGIINVYESPSKNDANLILTSTNNTIYVNCIHSSEDTPIPITQKNCQNLAGSMIANGICEGIIVTTDEIHHSALDYIEKLKLNSSLRITIINIDGIIKLLESKPVDDQYEIDVTL